MSLKRIGTTAATDGAVRTSPVYDPATGAVTAEVVLATADDVDRAVARAAEARTTVPVTSPEAGS